MSSRRVGTLDKKGKLGMWSKRFVSFDEETLQFVVQEKENGPPVFSATLRGVAAGGDNDPTAITFLGMNSEHQIVLRGANQVVSGEWYRACITAFERRGILRPKNAGLPKKDPRFNLTFVRTIPVEHLIRFSKLENNVFYWFEQVKTYEVKTVLSKPSLHERVAFLGDRCLYLTKLDSSVTHCVKVERCACVYTNFNLTKDQTKQFVVMKFAEQDIHVQGPRIRNLLNGLCAIYNYQHDGLKNLNVIDSEDALDGAVKLRFESDVKVAMVLPTTKPQLKKALDAFAEQHGIEFEQCEDDDPSGDHGEPRKRMNSSNSATTTSSTGGITLSSKAQHDPASPLNRSSNSVINSKAQEIISLIDTLPKNDPLAWFLIDCKLPQLYHPLRDQAVDLEVLEMMDSDDLGAFGINDPEMVACIREHILFPGFLDDAHEHAEHCVKGIEWTKPPRVIPSRNVSEVYEGGAGDGGDTEDPPFLHSNDSITNNNVFTPRSSGQGVSTSTNIVLDDTDDDSDSDLDLRMPPVRTQSQVAATKKMAIVLDSDTDDDDLNLIPNSAGFGTASPPRPPIVLDSDDDI